MHSRPKISFESERANLIANLYLSLNRAYRAKDVHCGDGMDILSGVFKKELVIFLTDLDM